MNVSFNRIFAGCYSLIRDKITHGLTPVEKKVVLVALAYFSCVTLCYFFYQYCDLNAHRVNRKKDKQFDDPPFIPSEPLPETSQEEGPLPLLSQEKDLFSLSSIPNESRLEEMTIEQDIQRRLDKNRRFAQEQQNKESAKGFALQKDQLPQSLWDKPLVNEEIEVNGRKVGIATCQGIRKEMQDADLATHCSFVIQDQQFHLDIFAVFDGHGVEGLQASTFVRENLVNYLEQALRSFYENGLSEVAVFQALKVCFKKLHADYQGQDGTTATAVLLLDKKIWVANIGDSRTILVKNGTATQASEDAKPTITRYKDQIKKHGGSIEQKYHPTFGSIGPLRVNGTLAVARAIGDKEVMGQGGECCVLPHPKITHYSLENFEEGYVVLACDGLYDVATTNEVGAAIKQMADQHLTENEMAKHLVHSALVLGSNDNVSVMVVKL